MINSDSDEFEFMNTIFLPNTHCAKSPKKHNRIVQSFNLHFFPDSNIHTISDASTYRRRFSNDIGSFTASRRCTEKIMYVISVLFTQTCIHYVCLCVCVDNKHDIVMCTHRDDLTSHLADSRSCGSTRAENTHRSPMSELSYATTSPAHLHCRILTRDQDFAPFVAVGRANGFAV